jgi:hypothetical protein
MATFIKAKVGHHQKLHESWRSQIVEVIASVTPVGSMPTALPDV